MRFNTDGMLNVENLFHRQSQHNSSFTKLALTYSTKGAEDEKPNFILHEAQPEIQEPETGQSNDERPF